METTQKLVITRVYNAPRELVYKAWSDAKALAQWWGPRGASIDIKKFDFRPGGIFHYSMSMPNGMIMWGMFIYRNILEPELIAFVNSFSDEDGNQTRSPYHPVWPLEILIHVSFEESEGKTTLTLKSRPINATEEEMNIFIAATDGMSNGFKGSFDKLEEYLANNQ